MFDTIFGCLTLDHRASDGGCVIARRNGKSGSQREKGSEVEALPTILGVGREPVCPARLVACRDLCLSLSSSTYDQNSRRRGETVRRSEL